MKRIAIVAAAMAAGLTLEGQDGPAAGPKEYFVQWKYDQPMRLETSCVIKTSCVIVSHSDDSGWSGGTSLTKSGGEVQYKITGVWTLQPAILGAGQGLLEELTIDGTLSEFRKPDQGREESKRGKNVFSWRRSGENKPVARGSFEEQLLMTLSDLPAIATEPSGADDGSGPLSRGRGAADGPGGGTCLLTPGLPVEAMTRLNLQDIRNVMGVLSSIPLPEKPIARNRSWKGPVHWLTALGEHDVNGLDDRKATFTVGWVDDKVALLKSNLSFSRGIGMMELKSQRNKVQDICRGRMPMIVCDLASGSSEMKFDVAQGYVVSDKGRIEATWIEAQPKQPGRDVTVQVSTYKAGISWDRVLKPVPPEK